MPLNFPSNPNLNDTYTSSGITWVYNGIGWSKTSTNTNFSNFTANIIPETNNLKTLGNITNRWKSIYLGPGSVDIDGTILSSNSGTLVITSNSGNISLSPNVVNFLTDVETTGGAVISSTTDVNEGANLYFTNARVYANVIGLINNKANVTDLITSNIGEGTNLYFTNARVYANVVSHLNLKANTTDLTTSNITEGTNLYFTNARVISALNAGTGISINANGLITGSSVSIYDTATNSTGYFALPSGNTAQRPGSPSYGIVRYNSQTGLAEVYTLAGWGNFGAQAPTVTSVSPVTFNGEQSTQFIINGANFSNDAIVKFVSSAGIEYTAATVTYVNSTQLAATTPQDFTVADGPLDVKVLQTSGTSTKLDAIDCGTIPAWSTASGNIATAYFPGNLSVFANVLASDPDSNGTVISYAITSGTLPDGLTFITSNARIYGNITNPNASVVTTNFNVTAVDNANNQSSARTFSIVRKWQDGSTEDQAAANANVIYNLSSSFRTANSNGIYWIKLPGQASASRVYCLMDSRINNGAWMLSYQKTTGSTLSYTYKQLWYINSAWNNTTFSHDTTNYPVLPNNISFANMSFTKQLINNQHPSWISYSNRGNYQWYNLQTDVNWTGSTVTANNYMLSTLTESTTSLWPRGVGWGDATTINSTWAWWADGGNGGLCGGAFQCATAACPTASPAEGCHTNGTYPLLMFVK